MLIPEFGAQGAAVMTAALEVTLAAIYGVLLARELPGLRPGYAFAPRLVLALGAAFAAGLPLLLVTRCRRPSWAGWSTSPCCGRCARSRRS